MMFAEPAVDLTRAYGSKGHYGRFARACAKLPEFGNELPVAATGRGGPHGGRMGRIRARSLRLQQPGALDDRTGASFDRGARQSRVHGLGVTCT